MPSARRVAVPGSGTGRISMVAVDVGAAPKKSKVAALKPKVTCPGLVAVKVAVARGLGTLKSQQGAPHSQKS